MINQRLVLVYAVEQGVDLLADRLGRGIAEQALRAWVPGADDAIDGYADQGVLRKFDDGGVLSQDFFHRLAGRNVHECDHDAVDHPIEPPVGPHAHDEARAAMGDLHFALDCSEVSKDACHIVAQITVGYSGDDLIKRTAAIGGPDMEEPGHRWRVSGSEWESDGLRLRWLGTAVDDRKHARRRERCHDQLPLVRLHYLSGPQFIERANASVLRRRRVFAWREPAKRQLRRRSNRLCPTSLYLRWQQSELYVRPLGERIVRRG